MTSPSGKYRVFKRSATNWEQFAKARKYTVETGLTYDEARRTCERCNKELTPAEIRKGLKYEFTAE